MREEAEKSAQPFTAGIMKDRKIMKGVHALIVQLMETP